ncbi:MAG: hypothetical protein EBZ51_13845 [Synechococcaceae bacterium WB9_2_112]|jgi:hypothetical protein|nr:hypothetical protein [Synechococcaceae bacterium WB9_2_112]
MDFAETESFIMIFHNDLRGALEALKAKQLQPADFAVLMAVMSAINHKTGMVEVTLTELGRAIGMPQWRVSVSIKRLRLQQLVATGYDSASGKRFLMVNPYLCGRRDDTKRFGLRWARFKELMSSD